MRQPQAGKRPDRIPAARNGAKENDQMPGRHDNAAEVMRNVQAHEMPTRGGDRADGEFRCRRCWPSHGRINAGEPIRIGFSNIPIWGYPDENGEAKGFVNEIAIGILKSMGYDKIETTVTDWGGLIPGLQANRYDLITGGLYILNSRCKNIAFSEPIAQAGDAFIVPAGNPKGIQNYQDILNTSSMLVTGAVAV